MRKRNHVIPVRLNARELRELEEQVEKSGLSREEFMRSLILGAQVHAKPCEHHPELLRKIAGLCNNANQLAHVANASGMASEQSVQEMLRLTKETWHRKELYSFLCRRMSGRGNYCTGMYYLFCLCSKPSGCRRYGVECSYNRVELCRRTGI